MKYLITCLGNFHLLAHCILQGDLLLICRNFIRAFQYVSINVSIAFCSNSCISGLWSFFQLLMFHLYLLECSLSKFCWNVGKRPSILWSFSEIYARFWWTLLELSIIYFISFWLNLSCCPLSTAQELWLSFFFWFLWFWI